MSALHRGRAAPAQAHSKTRNRGASGALNPVKKRETSLPGLQGAKNLFLLALRFRAAPKGLNLFLSNLCLFLWQLGRGQSLSSRSWEPLPQRSPGLSYWPFKRLRPARPQAA